MFGQMNKESFKQDKADVSESKSLYRRTAYAGEKGQSNCRRIGRCRFRMPAFCALRAEEKAWV